MKRKNRLFSLLLAVIMLVSMVPVTSAAAPADEAAPTEEPALTAADTVTHTVRFHANHPNGTVEDPEPLEVPNNWPVSAVVDDPYIYYNLGLHDGYKHLGGRWYTRTGNETSGYYYTDFSLERYVDQDMDLYAQWLAVSNVIETAAINVTIFEGNQVGEINTTRLTSDNYTCSYTYGMTGETYILGQEYTLILDLSTPNPNAFANAGEFSLTVNGEAVTPISVTPEHVKFSVTLTAQPLQAIENVALTLADEEGDTFRNFPSRLRESEGNGWYCYDIDLLPEGTYDPDDSEAVWETGETYQIGLTLHAKDGYEFCQVPSVTFNGSSATVVSCERISNKDVQVVLDFDPPSPQMWTVRFHANHPNGSASFADPPSVSVRDGCSYWQYMPREQYDEIQDRWFADGYSRDYDGWYTRSLNADGTYSYEYWYSTFPVEEDMDLYALWEPTTTVDREDLTINIYADHTVGEFELGGNYYSTVRCNDIKPEITYMDHWSYYLTFTMEVYDGYVYADDFVLTVNGKTITPTLSGPGRIQFTVQLYTKVSAEIDTITVDLYDIIGDRVYGYWQRFVWPEDSGYYVYAAADPLEGIDDMETAVWEAGRTYTINCEITADDGYFISDDPTIVFNGSTQGVTVEYFFDSKIMYLLCDFAPGETYVGPVTTEPDEDVDLVIGQWESLYSIGGAARISNWISSSPDTVSLDENGYFTALRYGDAVLTGTSADHRYQGVIRVHTRFSDVTDPEEFYYDYIYWGASEGYTTGWADGTFRPLNNCNRAAVMAFLYRMAGSPPVERPAVSPFSDVGPENDPGTEQFYDAILWGVQQGITNGWEMSDGTLEFRPWNTCNRAAIVTFLWRYAGEPAPTSMASFKDMTGNSDFDLAISWAAENGITTGWADNTFRPWNTCNRLAVMSFLYRYAHLDG